MADKRRYVNLADALEAVNSLRQYPNEPKPISMWDAALDRAAVALGGLPTTTLDTDNRFGAPGMMGG